MIDFSFKQLRKDKKTRARVGEITTPHGIIQTPAFVPCGTQGTVKSLTPEELNTLGVQLFFVNTYHMYLRPGIEIVEKAGGLHKFMHWDRPIITDSGGFQIFSQGAKITDDGVEFKSHWDGTKHTFTPESSMKWQEELGSDIHIAFDDCTPYPVTHDKARKSMERTHAWAKRSLQAHKKGALYGCIQGSVYKDLRQESAKFVSGMDFDGIAIGGVAVGESKKQMTDVLDWVAPLLPEDKPRHLLGVGEIDDIFMLVGRGIDTFDCVQPTRLARMGTLYSKFKIKNSKLKIENKQNTIDITKARHATDFTPIEDGCLCYTCKNFTRAYLHHLFHVRELLGYRLATIHNLHFIHRLVDDIRESILNNSFLELARAWL
jgi:queuine tRNA-ribosyltransferase